MLTPRKFLFKIITQFELSTLFLENHVFYLNYSHNYQ